MEAEDKVSECEMDVTHTVVMRDMQHKLVVVSVNDADIYVHTPGHARTLGQALIRAADAVEPAKPAVAVVKS